MLKQTDRGTVKAAWIKAISYILGALIALAGAVINGHFQRQIGIDEGVNRGTEHMEQQLDEVRADSYAQGFVDGENLSTQNFELIEQNLLMQNASKIAEYQYQISHLETEINSLQSEVSSLQTEINSLQSDINAFAAQGEQPIPRNPDSSTAASMNLSDITNIGNTLARSTVIRDNYDTTYSEALRFEGWYNTRSVHVFHALLDYRYTRVRGAIFVGYGEARNGAISVRFELDGVIYGPLVHTLDKTSRPIPVDIALSEVNDFRIIITRGSATRPHDYVQAYFGDIRFYP